MFRKFAAIIALLFALTACTANTAAAPAPAETPTPAAVQCVEEDSPEWDCEVHGNGICGPVDGAEEVLWPAVDNQLDALTQCFLYLEAGADRDDCVSAASIAFPVDLRPINA